MRISKKFAVLSTLAALTAALVACGGRSDPPIVIFTASPPVTSTEPPPVVPTEPPPIVPTEPVPFAFEPITLKKVSMPAGFNRFTGPVFLADGEHVVATAIQAGSKDSHIVLGNVRTGESSCLTCSGDPPPFQISGLIGPFPDGKRLFIGFSGVLECAPSILDCQRHTFLPYSLEGTRQPMHVMLGASPKLSPDGEHVAYSNIRRDGYQEMVVAKFIRQADKYVAEDARVINPQGPMSLADPSLENWSRGSALYELKTFTRGGAAVIYVQVGGEHSMNVDVWEVDLKTGARTRLTASPDWDEDLGVSPDGKTMAIYSNRTYHVFDWTGGMLPHRGFIDAPIAGALSGLVNNGRSHNFCGGPMWLLPASGDAGGTIAGQPIANYKDPNARVTVHVGGAPMWNPQSTMFALQLSSAPGGGVYAGNTPPYVLVAELSARKPTTPQPVVSSEVGPWAGTTLDYHPSFGYKGTVNLSGPVAGSVTLTFTPVVGVQLGTFSAKYENYSEDGKTFLNGTKAVDVRKTGLGEARFTADLVMSGERTGSVLGDLTYFSAGPAGTTPYPTSTGTFTVTYDGTTVSGPPSWLDDPTNACPSGQEVRAPQLVAQTKRVNGGTYKIKVTANVAGNGQNQARVDTRPVAHALINGGGQQVHTDDRGVATVTVSASTEFRVTAGDTLIPVVLTIDPVSDS